jgi:hypothetical protein
LGPGSLAPQMGGQQSHVDVVHQHEKDRETAEQVDAVEAIPAARGLRAIIQDHALFCPSPDLRAMHARSFYVRAKPVIGIEFPKVIYSCLQFRLHPVRGKGRSHLQEFLS